MFVPCVCCVLCGLAASVDEVVIRSEDSYRLSACVSSMCDLET